jgi:hypothetical protein
MAHCLPNHFHFQYKNKIAVNDKKRGYKTWANTQKFWNHAHKNTKLSKSIMTKMLHF